MKIKNVIRFGVLVLAGCPSISFADSGDDLVAAILANKHAHEDMNDVYGAYGDKHEGERAVVIAPIETDKYSKTETRDTSRFERSVDKGLDAASVEIQAKQYRELFRK